MPQTTLDERFSSSGATATDWTDGRRRIEDAELFWLSTVRPDGRPHVTPLISVWLDDAAYIEALVFEVVPTTVFGFGKGEYSQTRWRFRV